MRKKQFRKKVSSARWPNNHRNLKLKQKTTKSVTSGNMKNKIQQNRSKENKESAKSQYNLSKQSKLVKKQLHPQETLSKRAILPP